MDSAMFIALLPQLSLLLVTITLAVAYGTRLSRPPPRN